MKSTRLLIAVALVACLAACGNKGPLVHPTPPQSDVPAPASPPSTDPTTTLPPANPTPPPDADPGGAVPPTPPPDGGGHG
jgi:predicted small lipoprotein YifL